MSDTKTLRELLEALYGPPAGEPGAGPTGSGPDDGTPTDPDDGIDPDAPCTLSLGQAMRARGLLQSIGRTGVPIGEAARDRIREAVRAEAARLLAPAVEAAPVAVPAVAPAPVPDWRKRLLLWLSQWRPTAGFSPVVRIAFAAAAVAALLLAVSVEIAGPGPDDPVIPRVPRDRGEVARGFESVGGPLVAPEVVYRRGAVGVVRSQVPGLGDRASTAPDAALAWRLGDGAGVVLFADTTVRVVESRRTKTELLVDQGRALFQVRAGEAGGVARRFVVRTPHGEIRVTGTRFALDVGESRSVLEVQEGTVYVSARALDGQIAQVSAGESATFSLEERPVSRVSADDTGLQRALDVLGSIDPFEPTDEGIRKERFERFESELQSRPPNDPPPAAAGPARRPVAGRPAVPNGLDDTPEQLLAQAKRHLLGGESAQVIRVCDRLIARHPEHPGVGEALYRKASAELALGRVQSARATFRAVTTRPNDPFAETSYLQIARLERSRLNDPVEAYRWYGRYLDRFPRGAQVADVRLARCELAADAGHAAEQAAECGAFLDLVPHGPQAAEANYRRALALHRTARRPADALGNYDNALAEMRPEDPRRAEVRYNRAVALIQSGAGDAGRAELEELLRAYPDHPQRADIERRLEGR